MKKLFAIAVVATVFIVAACESNPNAQTDEADRRQDNYAALVEAQPAESMDHSPTRESINEWIRLWEEPGKLSYVYLMGANGQLIGYYVLKGLPVSYCAALSPTYEGYDFDGDGDSSEDVIVAAPSLDGVFYSGGQCNQYYGFDAETGAYMEWSIGDSLSYLLYDQPLPRQDVEPLGYTVIGDGGELSAPAGG